MNRFLRAMLNRMLGDRGERLAARQLRRAGLRIITRGYQADRGEIDLIAHEGKTVVFIEVKTRRSGQPAEAVNRRKQQSIVRAAHQFIHRFHLQDYPVRFDVVAILWPDDNRPPHVEHLRNAFDASCLDPPRRSR